MLLITIRSIVLTLDKSHFFLYQCINLESLCNTFASKILKWYGHMLHNSSTLHYATDFTKSNKELRPRKWMHVYSTTLEPCVLTDQPQCLYAAIKHTIHTEKSRRTLAVSHRKYNAQAQIKQDNEQLNCYVRHIWKMYTIKMIYLNF